MNMNMVLPAVGRNIKDYKSRTDQLNKMMYLLCSLQHEDRSFNIFSIKLRQFMVMDLLEGISVANVEALVNLSKNKALCGHISKEMDFFRTK